jgi:hypothetical protein
MRSSPPFATHSARSAHDTALPGAAGAASFFRMDSVTPFLLRTRRIAALTVGACTVLVAAKCPGASKASTPAAAVKTRTDSASQVLLGVKAPLTHQSVSRGIVRADTGFVYDDGARVELHGHVTVSLVSAEGLNDGNITARTAVYTMNDSHLTLRELVIATSATGRRIETAALIYDLKENQLQGAGAYQLFESKTAKAQSATGFEADPRLTTVAKPGTLAAARRAEAEKAAKAAAALKAAADKAEAARAAAAAKKSAAKPRR